MIVDNHLEIPHPRPNPRLLLPKLMSGEIRLRDAERAVEAVL